MSRVTVAAAALEIGSAGGGLQTRALSGPATVGRSASADIALDHPSVSRRHAQLLANDQGRWVVRDLNSRNGTTVNGAAIAEKLLRNGDLLRFGEVTARFCQADEPRIADAADDAPGFTLTRLGRLQTARISAEHVAAILSFGRSLGGIEQASDRLRRLVELPVSRDLGAWWSYGLRVVADAADLDIRPLCPPANSAYGASREPHVSKSVLRAVLEGGEPVIANNLARLPRFQAEVTLPGDSAPFSAVACPLAADGPAVHILYVILPPEMGTVEWLALLSLAAEQYRHAESAWSARAAGEARAAIDREMGLARIVQARTVPERRGDDVLDWAVRFEPCLSVGGDYVDVVARGDGNVLLAIADAAGKGMQAALITAGLHAIFNTAGRADTPLTDLIAAADRYLRAFLPDGSFVTLAALLLDPRTGEGACVSCGHLPMMAVRPGGTGRTLPGGDNLPLGVRDDPIVSAPVRVEPGEWIVGYTDGLTEMRNPAGEMLGVQPLCDELVRACASAENCSADEMAGHVFEWLDTYRGQAVASDDRTLLVARRLP